VILHWKLSWKCCTIYVLWHLVFNVSYQIIKPWHIVVTAHVWSGCPFQGRQQCSTWYSLDLYFNEELRYGWVVHICFCNWWNTTEGVPGATMFAATNASFEYSHITLLIYICSRWTDFQKRRWIISPKENIKMEKKKRYENTEQKTLTHSSDHESGNKDSGKILLVLSELRTVTWRCIREWRYISTYS
jgi:hypothetical protein